MFAFSLNAFAQTAFVYQGQLSDQGQLAAGQYDLEFELYDALSAGNQVGVTIEKLNTAVTEGVFTVELDFGSGVYDGSALWLTTRVKQAGQPSYTELLPRLSLAATPYASFAYAVADNSVGENQVQSGSITQGHLQVDSVSTDKLQDFSVTGDKLSDGSVNGVKIVDGAVDSSKIQDGSIMAADIDTGSITQGHLQVDSVSTDKLQDFSVTGDKLSDGSVNADKISDGSVNADKISDGSVNGVKIVDGAVDSSKIQDGSIVAADIDTGSIQARITGSCGGNAAITSVAPGGQVVCTTVPEIPDLAKITYVAQSGGDYTSITDALNNISLGDAWCGTPSLENPCTLKILPGIYDLAGGSLVLDSGVNVEGSGIGSTIIRSSYLADSDGVLFVEGDADKAKISDLSIHWNGSTTAGFPLHLIRDETGASYENIQLVIGGTPADVDAFYIDGADSSPRIRNLVIDIEDSSLADNWNILKTETVLRLHLNGLVMEHDFGQVAIGAEIRVLNDYASQQLKLSNVNVNAFIDDDAFTTLELARLTYTEDVELNEVNVNFAVNGLVPGDFSTYLSGIYLLAVPDATVNNVEFNFDSNSCHAISLFSVLSGELVYAKIMNSYFMCSSATGVGVLSVAIDPMTTAEIMASWLNIARPVSLTPGNTAVCGSVFGPNLTPLSSACQ